MQLKFFDLHIKRVYNVCIPLLVVSTSPRRYNPWFPDNVHQSLLEREFERDLAYKDLLYMQSIDKSSSIKTV